MQFSSIQPIDRTLSGATILGQNGPGSNGNKGELHIPQSSSITGTSSSECLVSYPGLSLGWGFTPLQKCSQCILQPQPTGWQYFGNMKDNFDVLAEFMKVMNNTQLWYSWYSLSTTHKICLHDLGLCYWICGLLDLAWPSRSLRLKRNFLNHLVTALWSDRRSPLPQQRFLVASASLWPIPNS